MFLFYILVFIIFSQASGFLELPLFTPLLFLNLYFLFLGFLVGIKSFYRIDSVILFSLLSHLIISLLGIFYAQDIDWTLLYIEEMFEAFLLFFIFSQIVYDRKAILNTIKLILIFAVITTSFALLGYQGTKSIPGLGAHRILRLSGVWLDPNYAAMSWVGYLSISAFFIFFSKEIFFKLIALFGLFIFFTSVFFSFSRAGFLSLLVLGILLIWKLSERKTSRLFLFLIIGLCIGIISYIFLPDIVIMRIKSLTLLSKKISLDLSFYQRFLLFKTSLRAFIENFFFGVGPYNFIIYARKYMPYPMVAHNTYLEVASGNGIIGITSYLIFIGRILYLLNKAEKTFLERREYLLQKLSGILKIGLIAMLFAAFFISVPFKIDLWVFLSLAFCIYRYSENGQKENTYKNRIG